MKTENIRIIMNIELLKEKFGFPLIYTPEDTDEPMRETMVLSEDKTIELYNGYLSENYESLSHIMLKLDRDLDKLFDSNFELEKEERPGINFIGDEKFLESCSLEKLFRLESQCHDGKIQSAIGYRFYAGIGVQQSYENALFWFEKAEEHSDFDARYYLGVMYDLGLGVQQDLAKARDYYYPVVPEQGEKVSEIIGAMYFEDVGCPENYPDTISETIAMSEKGNIYVQYKLATLYRNGFGLEKNKDKAMELYSKAAAAGLKEAKDELEKMKKDNKF